MADFIGVSNFLQGRVEMIHEGHLLVVTDKGLKVRVACEPGRQVHKGDRLQLTLRPEKVDISSSPATPDANTCAGTIRHIVYLGTVTHYYVISDDGEAFVIYCQNQAAAHACGRLRVGDAIHLSWRPEHTLMLENDEDPSDVVAGKESA